MSRQHTPPTAPPEEPAIEGLGQALSVCSGPLPALLFFKAVEQAPVAISITDLEARILYVNPAFTEVTGYSSAAAVGQRQAILADASTPRELYTALWQTLAAGKHWSGTLINRRCDGSRYLADLHITPVVGAAGQVTHYLGMQRDVTQMHQLAQQVSNQKALIESVVDAEPVAIALLDEQGQVVLNNQAYRKLAEELAGQEPAQIFLHSLSQLGVDLQKARASGAGFVDYELSYQGSRWFSCSGTWFKERDSSADHFFAPRRVEYLLLVAKEITTLRRQQEEMRMNALRALTAEEELVQSLRETLAAAIYQLQGPLNIMQAAVNMLKRRSGNHASTDPLLPVLKEALDSGQQALETLRASMPEEPEEAVTPVNLNALLRDVLGLSTHRLLANGIVVDWQPAAVLPPVLGREKSLRGMLKQLIDNALDAMQGSGIKTRELHILTRAEEDTVHIRVRDTGPGIPEHLRLRVFEPFFSTKGHSGRAGMGLPLVQEIVSQHAGMVEIDPTCTPGCCVHLRFPIAAKSALRSVDDEVA